MKIFDAFYSFFESIREYIKNFSNLFFIFLGAFLVMSIVIIIITSFAYECQLTKTIDKINKFLERNPRINDDNLVAFNNLMKANNVPKTLRRQWQQFMLYREHPASYYMSFHHCVENPMRNSSYHQQMTVYKVISYVLVVLSLVASTFMATNSYSSALAWQEILIIPITILALYWLVSMVLDLIHSAISGDLFQNYQYFEINMDKAMLTLPEFVDYEVLFSQDEIRRGIPVLFAYLQKRAIQEQQELEKARLKSVDHEKFDFDKAGLDGSLVLDRAMRETENFTTQRKKYMQEIERVNNEIAVLENNYREQVKEYQRQVQTSKETVENLKEQLEQATSTIEINYIKKQMRDEINRQQLAEKDFDILTDKHNQEIKSLNQEIKRYEQETKNAKEALEVAMLSEFNTYSLKVYDNLEKIVDEKMQNKVDDYKGQIKGLEDQLEEKDEELENVYTRYQEALSQLPAEPQSEIEPEYVEPVPTKKSKKKKKNSDSNDGMVQPEQIDNQQPEYSDDYMQYDENQYDNYQNAEQPYNGTEEYYDDSQNYDYNNNEEYSYDNNQEYSYDENEEYNYDNNEDHQYDNYSNYDENGYAETNEYYGDEQYVPLNDAEYDAEQQYVPLDDYSQENFDGEYVPLNEEYTPLNEEDWSQSDEEYIPLNDGIANVDEVNGSATGNVENADDLLNSEYLAENDTFDDSDFDIDFNKTEDGENDNDFSFDFGDDKADEDKNKAVEEEPKKPSIETIEQDVDADFDINKILGIYDESNDKVQEKEDTIVNENVENDEYAESDENDDGDIDDSMDEELPAPEAPKRKAGRPRKNIDESEIKPKRAVGRPRKVVVEEEKPKRRVGRPRKVVTEDEVLDKPKKRVGRPRKQVTEEAPKRKAGRPRKVVDDTTILEKPKRRVGRPKKSNEDKQTRKVGRPRKDADRQVAKVGRPKKSNTDKQVRRVGRPKKAKESNVKSTRKVGRPKKNATEKVVRKVGRPRKTN